VTTDTRPSIADLRQAYECTREGCWTDARDRLVDASPVLLEIAETALALQSAGEEVTRVLDVLSPDSDIVTASIAKAHECELAYEAALAKVRR
jgi:hypothetical protein